MGVAKGNRENSGGIGTVRDGSLSDGPSLAAIRRVKDPRSGPASNEPDFFFPERGDASSAGSERAFAGYRCWKMRRRQRIPVRAVIGGNQFKFQLALRIGNWVADGDAVSGVPESHAIEEAFGIGIRELQRPVLAGIGSFVDAGSVCGAGGEKIGDIGIEGLDIAEIEGVRAGNLRCGPRVPAVHGAEISSVRTAGQAIP